MVRQMLRAPISGVAHRFATAVPKEPTLLSRMIEFVDVSPVGVRSSRPRKTLCAAAATRTDVENWAKVGPTDKAATQTYLNEFKDEMIGGSGFISGFNKGDTIPAGVLIATDFGNGESEDYVSFPVNPIAHYRSWGLFEVTGSFVAPNVNGGWCATIR